MSQAITNLISSLRSQTQPNSITPEVLGNVLQQMANEIDRIQGIQSAASVGEYLFASIHGTTVTGAHETELYIESSKIDFDSCNALIWFNDEPDDCGIITAEEDCYVHITGQINMQPSGSYTSDRVLRWFKYDEDGERYCDSVMTTHYTGTTQIFNIPIDYSCYLLQGQSLHLTCFASGSNDTLISSNSRINVQAFPA